MEIVAKIYDAIMRAKIPAVLFSNLVKIKKFNILDGIPTKKLIIAKSLNLILVKPAA